MQFQPVYLPGLEISLISQQPIKKWHRSTYSSIDPTRPELSTSGKNVLITTGGNIISHTMAFSFAAAGASSITLMGQYEESLRKTTAEVKAKYPSVKILYEAVDITNRDQVEPAMERIVSLVGDLSILVCNGGDMPQLEDSIRVTPEQFHYAIDIATWGCINMVQSFKPRSTNGAIIINVSAAFTHTRSLHDMSVRYFSRLANFMEHLATENSDLHIVNMHPGVVQRLVNSNDQGAPRIDLDDPSLPADFTVWLASPEAAFLKGEIVWANWDVDELISRKCLSTS